MPTVKETFDAMAGRFRAEKAAGVNATIQYDITGDQGGTWNAVIKDGACKVSEAKAAKRSGFDAHNSASFSFWIFTTAAASSRSRPYQNGLIDSTSISIAIASISFRRCSIAMKCSGTPLTGGSTLSASAPIRLIDSRK